MCQVKLSLAVNVLIVSNTCLDEERRCTFFDLESLNVDEVRLLQRLIDVPSLHLNTFIKRVKTILVEINARLERVHESYLNITHFQLALLLSSES